MTEWLPFVKEVGLPVALVIAFLLFLWKGFWPFMNKQIDEARTARREDQDKFLAALERRDKLADAQTQAFAEALRVTDEQRGARR